MGFTDNYSKKVPATTVRQSHVEQKPSARKASTNPADDTFLFNIFHENDDDDDVDGGRSDTTVLPDQEILDSTETIYFQENVDTSIYELRVSDFLPFQWDFFFLSDSFLTEMKLFWKLWNFVVLFGGNFLVYDGNFLFCPAFLAIFRVSLIFLPNYAFLD